MIDGNYKLRTVECDECGEIYEHEKTVFADFITIIKDNGWTIIRDEGEFVHLCARCS